MREAKSLGIPLRQPGTGPGRAERRSSISQLTDSDHGADVWACSHCHRTVVDPPSRTSRTPATAPVLPKNASPFKDMFRIGNIFGRKAKDDSRSKVKQALTLPRGQAAWSSSVCEGCSQAAEVTSSPCSRRQAGAGQSERIKYRRSASTPRPAGDGRIQLLQPATDHRRTHAAGTIVY